MTELNNQLSRFLKIEPSAVRSQHELTPARRSLRVLFFRMQSELGLRSDCSAGMVKLGGLSAAPEVTQVKGFKT